MIWKQPSQTFMKEKKSFLRFSLLVFTGLFLLSGCLGSALNYRPSADLQEQYRYTAFSEHFRAYYDVIPAEGGTLVRGVLQNTSRTFATNVTLNINEAPSGRYEDRSYLFKSLGSIKMLSHKPFEFLALGENTPELIVAYEFIPSVEDDFMNQKPDDRSDVRSMDFEHIKGTIRLPLTKPE